MNVFQKNRTLGRRGVTLVELMVVIALIGLVIAIGVPQVRRFAAKERIRRPASDLIQTMRELRATAIKENRAYTVVFYPAQNVYMYGFDQDGDGNFDVNTGTNDLQDTFGVCNDTDNPQDRLPNINNPLVVQGVTTRECVRTVDLRAVYGEEVQFGTQADFDPADAALAAGACNGRTVCFPDTGNGTAIIFNANGSVNTTGTVYLRHAVLSYSYAVRVGTLAGAINVSAWNGEPADNYVTDPPIQPAAAPNWREVR